MGKGSNGWKKPKKAHVSPVASLVSPHSRSGEWRPIAWPGPSSGHDCLEPGRGGLFEVRMGGGKVCVCGGGGGGGLGGHRQARFSGALVSRAENEMAVGWCFNVS